ncbi:uncharacterized protein CTRU02_206968 [Colletotrichum truncatum]|uniref:Uncharacterized protein n=1 Tax=Colletotrichum truncatum TaxID=5467 RepID=A0ACC3YZH3_COLTU|nr:uncharacterized protein CTRU02_11178 [Colletotrichum truncatum]KAF6786307.1 hypothetical protein CTRU02_11178 [Colletotrichum truncatum]
MWEAMQCQLNLPRSATGILPAQNPNLHQRKLNWPCRRRRYTSHGVASTFIRR